ncbi:MAG: hypothetical protein GY938_12745 [Ketobacter sp.]|nr:hypothetical protein [Ketobacter sp.]
MDEFPDTKTINGQTAVKCISSNPNFPGCIYVPRELTPEQFTIWWKSANNERDDIPYEQAVYQDCHHLVLEWNVKNLKLNHYTPDGEKFPSVWFWGFVYASTKLQVEAAQQPPKLQSNWIELLNGVPVSENGETS